MDSTEHDPLHAFVQNVIGNLQKHGFPEKSVAFPLERMYEAADRKELSLNRVLEVLEGLGVLHEKTPEKIVFRSIVHAPAVEDHPFAGMDLGALQGMSPEQQMAAAAQMMQQLSPEQLTALQAMVGGLSDADRAQMIEQARKMGLL